MEKLRIQQIICLLTFWDELLFNNVVFDLFFDNLLIQGFYLFVFIHPFIE